MPGTPAYNDLQLFAAIAVGDEAAFKTCFEKWHNTLYAAALTYLKVHEAAMDVVQQSFTKLWEKRTQLVTVEKPLDYLFIICRNECLDILRKLAANKTYTELMGELFDPGTADPNDNPDQQLITKEIRTLLTTAIKELPDQQRAVWKLIREEGMSYKQAASTLGLTPFTVKAYLARATQKVASKLKSHNPDLYAFFMLWLMR